MLSNAPFEKIKTAHLMMGCSGGSKWKEGNNLFFKVMWIALDIQMMLWKRAPLLPVYLIPGLLCSAFSSTEERSQQPISSTCGHQLLPWPPALVDKWPHCIPQALHLKWRQPWVHSRISSCFKKDAHGEEQHPSAPWHSAGSVFGGVQSLHSTPLYLT